MTTYTDDTCGTCRHWHAMPRPRVMTPDGPGVDLTTPQGGECREQLHALPVLNPSSGQMVGWITGYAPLGEGFPACSRFEVAPGANGEQAPARGGRIQT